MHNSQLAMDYFVSILYYSSQSFLNLYYFAQSLYYFVFTSKDPPPQPNLCGRGSDI